LNVPISLVERKLQNVIRCIYIYISGAINATVEVVKESGSYIIIAIACVGSIESNHNRILTSLLWEFLNYKVRLMHRPKIVNCEAIENCKSSGPLP